MTNLEANIERCLLTLKRETRGKNKIRTCLFWMFSNRVLYVYNQIISVSYQHDI